ncbi:MAG: DUF3341 domain-containing protein [Anaerolineales bacterium]|nr:MAG: DUF3341 domain-containing protein [Anaerolineales bacterium]
MAETNRLMALFSKATATAVAIDGLHEAGVADEAITVITGVPYPERSIGRHVEWLRLPQIVVAGALGGLIFGLFLSAITPHLYRLDVGGHPAVGFAPAAIITFVFTMQATIISTFLGVVWEMNFPEFGPKYYDKRINDGFIGVLVEFPAEMQTQVQELLEVNGGSNIHRPEKQPL